MSKVIEVKIENQYFNAVISGKKKAELRFNDRDYQVDDTLMLKEIQNGQYTGRSIDTRITHVLSNCGFGLQEGYAILSIEIIRRQK